VVVTITQEIEQMALKYRRGPRILVELPLDSTSADITPGTAITDSGATSGYFKEVDAAAESVKGISVNKVSSPSSDGGAYVTVDISDLSVYQADPDSGTIAITANQKTCDIGADGTSIDHDGSSTDDIVVLAVDLNDNTALIRLKHTFSGVA